MRIMIEENGEKAKASHWYLVLIVQNNFGHYVVVVRWILTHIVLSDARISRIDHHRTRKEQDRRFNLMLDITRRAFLKHLFKTSYTRFCDEVRRTGE